MRAKFINESENLEWSQFGPQFIMNFVQKNFSFLMKYHPEYLDMSGRGTGPENPGYGDDEIFEKWDYVGLDIPGIEDSLSMLIAQEDGKMGVKFYHDSVSFNGETLDDEYINYMPLIPVEEVDEELIEKIIGQLKEYQGIEDDDNEYSDNMLGHN